MEEQPDKNPPSGIAGLMRLIASLRGENGCPWDRKQTPRTMAVYLIEELYELLDAIETGKNDAVCEELGDVLFHIMFIAHLFHEQGAFDIEAVSRQVMEKMIRRHPHVFGDHRLDSADAVKDQWYKIKEAEKSSERPASVLDSVPKKTPALVRAYRISERAARTGFDWEDVWGVMQKVEEEYSELRFALKQENPENISSEVGDLLFTLVNVGRFAGVHPEPALTGSIEKFEKRFRMMEKAIQKTGRDLKSVPRQEKDVYWDRAKGKLKADRFTDPPHEP